MHIPQQLRVLGQYIDAFPLEARHKRYKENVAACYAQHVNKPKVSLFLLCRMLREQLEQAEQIHERPRQEDRLLPPIYSPSEMAAVFDCRGESLCASGQARIGQIQWREGDVCQHVGGWSVLRMFLQDGHGKLFCVVDDLLVTHHDHALSGIVQRQVRRAVSDMGTLFAPAWLRQFKDKYYIVA